ncbi:bicaudal D-related protein homolog [Macrosteles quadrilineatus]|uniref:bicaudal D-related protein homolog n=1 Tax=Macrosteles quadrilineatus TaxID=74068 RepID=UPI0023E30E9E|nr:bicaudal D-related protein homolog [Macrosteles quadrilineatus]XP_054289242.1 bicaudal D-related protein homolog [Macrosteles quadrilineatus]
MFATKQRNSINLKRGMMHRDKMKPKYALEDYIYDVESRSLEPSADPEDVYAQLQQKEKDLILAAELGKALLEKNEELSRQNERLAEEYSQKLEVIEQDRHLLRRKLVSSQAEYDTRIIELQADIRELQRSLEKTEHDLKATEKEKTLFISELTEQNQRLTTQIKESSKTEEQLTLQLQGLRDQWNMRKSSLQDHQSSLEVLKDEIYLMSEKKGELERRLQNVVSQRDSLSSALDEATDRIMMLEKTTREQELELLANQRELEELRSENSPERDRLTLLHSHNTSLGNRSLHSEMECDDSIVPLGDDHHQLKLEIVSVYDRVRSACQDLKHRIHRTDIPMKPDITVHQVKVGLLTSVVQELCDLVGELNTGDYNNSSVSVTDLEVELHRAQEAVDKMTKDIEAKKEEIKKQGEAIMDLTGKLSVKEVELSGAQEALDLARADLHDAGALAKDEMVQKAFEVRDGAVQRKNATLLQLAHTRIELMQANSQLMEAIQQKVELSQQLDQWQMDMQSLLDEQMRRKLANPEPEQSSSGQSTPASAERKRTSRRLFGLFQR